MQHQAEKKDVIVVAVDINRQDPLFEKFSELESDAQFQVLKDKILSVCEQLKKRHPDSKWIIAWREFGITGMTDSGEKQHAVSVDFKNRYKAMLSAIILEYPNLTIVAGTVATERTGSSEKLERIKKSYTDLSEYHHEEIKTTGNRDEAREFDRHMQELKDVEKQNESKDDPHFKIIRNTCYVFTGKLNKDNSPTFAVKKHSKTTPRQDSNVSKFTGLRVFHPGDKDSKCPIIDINDGIRIATELCREHDFQVTKKEAAKQNLQQSDILLHFVISDSIMLNPRNFYGQYVLQLDSTNRPKLIIADTTNPLAANVTLYQLNLLDAKHDLIGPVEPLRELFPEIVTREFETKIEATNNPKIKALLEYILSEFQKSSLTFESSPMYNTLEKFLTSRKIRYALCADDEKNLLPFLGKGEMASWIDKILKKVEREKKIHPDFQAYVSRKKLK